ncbi:MAG: zinc carboxypeptidase, partial [Thermoplasmata archaeon]|nr:zinc carboxypeptidase [Thermoplasmata archaeon]
VMKISDNPTQDEPDEPDVLIIGAHHGDEWIGNEQAFYIIRYLTENYGSDPRATWLVDNREFWIVPMANPDGTEYSHNEGMWRKNRSPNYLSEKTPGPWDPEIYATSYGTDLNRNYGYQWGEVGGSGELPSSGTYEGSGPFSELESQAIRDLVNSLDFTVSVDYHSGIELILYPWGYTEDPPPDADLFIAIAERMKEMNGYEFEQGWELYQTSGSTLDWFYGEHDIIAYTIELSGPTKRPPYEELEEFYLLNNTKASLYLAEIAAEPEVGAAIEIVHEPIERATDDGPYPVTAEIRGVNLGEDSSSGNMVELFYQVDGGKFRRVPMSRSDDSSKPYEWSGEIPTQGPGTEVGYFIAVTYQENRVTSPNILDVNSFNIEESELSQTSDLEWAAMVIMMIIIFTVIWGGFIYSARLAILTERRKMHDYRYTYGND